jgi:hypothetical protein
MKVYQNMTQLNKQKHRKLRGNFIALERKERPNILLGSWWAYHELGWGAWWFWSLVENASLMPWILATTCIHLVILPKLNYWIFFLLIWLLFYVVF